METPKSFIVVVINNWKEKNKKKSVHFEAYILLAFTKRTMNKESERITRCSDSVTNIREDVNKVLKGRRNSVLHNGVRFLIKVQ